MVNESSGFLRLLPSFQNKDDFFELIIGEKNLAPQIRQSGMLLTCLLFFYGIIMGSYTGILQAFTAGIKVPILFLLSLIICFPAFFLLQYILGSKMKLSQMTAIILSGFVQTAAIVVSFSPVVIFFMLTGGNYHFLQLLHVAIFTLSGFFGMKTILDALKFSCERKSVYPKMGVVVFRFWIVILAFVGIQLAWNLRPFLAEQDRPYALFRKYEGNFYTAVTYSIQKLMHPEEEIKPPVRPKNIFPMYPDTTKENK